MMTMPEAAVNEDDGFIFWKNDVRFAGKPHPLSLSTAWRGVMTMQAIPKAVGM